MSILEDEIQRLKMQLKQIKEKMDANYRNKDKKLRWYKEYLLIKQRLQKAERDLYRLEHPQYIRRIPQIEIIREEPQQKTFWGKISDWWAG